MTSKRDGATTKRHFIARKAGAVDAKEAAARKAITYVRDGMTLGLGTGSTAAWALRALGERVQNEGLQVRGVATSAHSQKLAMALGIPLMSLSEVEAIDLTIDGADEIDPFLNCIKGGGGALVREKLVAYASREFVVICDERKTKPALGTFPIPVAVVPFGWETTQRRLQRLTPNVTLRLAADNAPYVTDDGLHILDLHMGLIADPADWERRLKMVAGVAEVGLFVGMAARVVIGFDDGHTEERLPQPAA